MQRTNVPDSQTDQFAGKWVAVQNRRIVAVADELKELEKLVAGTEKTPPTATAFKVPYKGEGPYVL